MSSTSQFSPREILSIIVAWLVLSVAITYQNLIGLLSAPVQGSLDFVLAGFIATATGFILHEMGHKFVAVRRGYVAHFKVWTWGLVLTLGTAILSGGAFLFGAPGAVYIMPKGAMMGYYGYEHTGTRTDPEQENMIISAAGPGINLAFALVFLGIFLTTPLKSLLSIIALSGLGLNVGLGSFNMLPIPPLDGSKIFRKNIAVALALAGPLWAMFALLFSGFFQIS